MPANSHLPVTSRNTGAPLSPSAGIPSSSVAFGGRRISEEGIFSRIGSIIRIGYVVSDNNGIRYTRGDSYAHNSPRPFQNILPNDERQPPLRYPLAHLITSPAPP